MAELHGVCHSFLMSEHTERVGVGEGRQWSGMGSSKNPALGVAQPVRPVWLWPHQYFKAIFKITINDPFQTKILKNK